MIYRLFASLVLLLHFIFVALAVFGAFGVLIDRRWALVHVPIVVWSSVVNLAGWTCPLTPLENRLRAAANGTGYEGGFFMGCGPPDPAVNADTPPAALPARSRVTG